MLWNYLYDPWCTTLIRRACRTPFCEYFGQAGERPLPITMTMIITIAKIAVVSLLPNSPCVNLNDGVRASPGVPVDDRFGD